LEDDRIVDPVKLLQEQYRHVFTMSERHLLQLESQGAIVTYAIEKGQKEVFQGGSERDSYYLLFGELRYNINNEREGILKVEGTVVKPLALAEDEILSLFAQEDSLLCRADSNQIDYMVSWKSLIEATDTDSHEISIRLSELNNPTIFMQLPFENVEMAFKKMKEIDVCAGDEIITQGDHAELFYIIESGSAEVLQRGIYDSEQLQVAVLGVGDHFGEDALITEGARNATIRMLEDGRLWALGSDDFQSLIHSELVKSISSENALRLNQEGAVFLDVRYEEEYYDLHLQDAIQMSLPELRLRLNELDYRIHYITYCNSSRRSSVAALILSEAGYQTEYLKGGVSQWPYELVDEMGGETYTANKQ